MLEYLLNRVLQFRSHRVQSTMDHNGYGKLNRLQIYDTQQIKHYRQPTRHSKVLHSRTWPYHMQYCSSLLVHQKLMTSQILELKINLNLKGVAIAIKSKESLTIQHYLDYITQIQLLAG